MYNNIIVDVLSYIVMTSYYYILLCETGYIICNDIIVDILYYIIMVQYYNMKACAKASVNCFTCVSCMLLGNLSPLLLHSHVGLR